MTNAYEIVDKLVEELKPDRVSGERLDIIGESQFTKALAKRCREWDVPYHFCESTHGSCPVVYDREWCKANGKKVFLTAREDIDTGRSLSACAEAIIAILEELTDLRGKNVLIIGRGGAVKGLAEELIDDDATVTVCHSHTKDICDLSLHADIVVSAENCQKYIPLCVLDKITVDVSGKRAASKRLDSVYVSASEIGRLTCAILANRAARWTV